MHASQTVQGNKGKKIVNNRGSVLALAVALSSADETTLGPTDSALCAEALRHYARAQTHDGVMKALRIPALLASVCIGMVAADFQEVTSFVNAATADSAKPVQLPATGLAFESYDELTKQGLRGFSVAPPFESRPYTTVSERKG